MVATTVTILGAACSLPVNGEVRALDQEDFDDVINGVPTSTTVALDEDELTPIRLYFVVGQEGLGLVFRPLTETRISDVLAALEAQPTEDEIAEYEAEFQATLQTLLPADLNATPRARDEGSSLVQIEVNDEGVLRSMTEQNLGRAAFVFSQIVCTLTNLNLEDPIDSVEFYDAEGPIPIIDADLSRIPDQRAATRGDFRECETLRDRREAAEAAEAEAEGETTSTTGG